MYKFLIDVIVDALLDSLAYIVSKNKEMLLQRVSDTLELIIQLGD